MTEPEEICTAYLGTSTKDNDYTLYADGRVKRFYDENDWKYNLTEWLRAENLSSQVKESLLDRCSEENKDKARKLLYP
ncbi:hypothetical protein H6G76_24060 [Nostoc sp. FACHB-152]|uniref:hypothetical protein n=1 Tax=unclassified Nostoc TaxID=2593658 RepID=UPI00168990CF|nr:MULTISPECIES: hypothetical protein [unclassified Nostoc]MBD2450178.1 hypothetical protein [Nostoc sp. FACHB-152]MBD2469001.1 hypothetical protein [Nostoc sp. FACHB-145]